MSSPNDGKKDPADTGRNYVQYTGMAFQLVALLAIAAFIGQKLDQWVGTQTPYFTAAMALLALVGYLIKLYYDLS